MVVASIVAAGAVLYAVLWWQERPLTLAEAALRQDDPAEAIRQVDRFLAEHPTHGRALALRARSFVALKRPNEALLLFHQIGAAAPDDVHAWARAHLMREEWTAALPLLVRVLQVKPDDSDALYEISACRARLGLYAEALDSAERFARLPGHEARGYVFVATLNNDLGNRAAAAEAFAQVLKLAPDGMGLQVAPDEFFLEYGRTLLQLGRPQEAAEQFERSMKLRPTDETYVLWGDALSQLDKTDEAIDAWHSALERNSSNREAREALANASLRAGDAAQALMLLEPLKLSPKLQSSTAYILQRAFTALRDEEAAREWQEKTAALRESERRTRTLDNLARESPESSWGRAIRAHRFASEGNWGQAQLMVAHLMAQGNRTPFVVELAEAVRTRGPLPSVEKIPLTEF